MTCRHGVCHRRDVAMAPPITKSFDLDNLILFAMPRNGHIWFLHAVLAFFRSVHFYIRDFYQRQTKITMVALEKRIMTNTLNEHVPI